MYKLYKNTMTNEVVGAMKQHGQRVVSFMFSDPANTDYQEFLKFLAQGGQPLPADEVDNG
jgi:hypothetical protein